MTRLLILLFIYFSVDSYGQIQYADVLLDSYYSGTVSQFSNFYGVDGSGDLALVNPEICLDNNPWFVCISKDSYLTVGFTDNAIFDAPDQNDIFIQEKGNGNELAEIYVSSDMGASFVFFGVVNGGTTNSIDLADIGYTGLVNAIKIVGLDNNGSAPGFDLARIYGIEGANCEADAQIDIPSVCQDSILDLSQFSDGSWSGSSWNGAQYNTQDTGWTSIIHIVADKFAPCPNDTAKVNIHVSPCDCSGLPYGENKIDICGLCLDPSVDTFDTSCKDCAGVPYGTSTIDICGICHFADSESACTFDNIFYLPNAFSPNGDGINDIFQLYTRTGISGEIIRFSIYNRWGSIVFEQRNQPLHSTDQGWNGLSNSKKAQNGVYVYHLIVQLAEGDVQEFSGELTLLR